MKKLILLFFITTSFLACESSDDTTDSEDTSVFNPPTWIQGTWESEVLDSSGVKFTTDNFCTIALDNDTCYKTIIDSSLGLISVENETSTDTDYEFTIKRPTNSTSFHYRKKTDTSIVLVVLEIETTVLNKEED